MEGLSPSKSKHEFYVDIAPDFGFPLAIRPRFQLNAVINRDPDVPAMKVIILMMMMMIIIMMMMMKDFADELILPFLWAQDGFSEPSQEMADAIRSEFKHTSHLLETLVNKPSLNGGLVSRHEKLYIFYKCFFRFGVEAPSKLSLLGGVALIAVGGALILSVLVKFVMKYFL